MPRLKPIYEKYKDSGFEIVAVEALRMEELAKKFIEENKLTFHFVQDNEGESAMVRRVYKVPAFPTTLIIDKTGRVVFTHLGFSEGDEKGLEKEIKELL